MDLLIRNALLFDGTGGEPRACDVGVSMGRISAVEPRLEGPADEVVDLRGAALCPGFIDVHSHSDNSYVIEPLADSKIRQGVTTEVIGNCGMSHGLLGGDMQAEYVRTMSEKWGVTVTWSNFREYFSYIEALGMRTHCVALIGHGDMRSMVMGDRDVPVGPADMGRMEALTAQALTDGAWGVSTGLIYVPGAFAQVEELVSLARVARRFGGCYTSHIRGEGDTLESAVAEAICVGRGSGAMTEVSHHKASGVGNWGKVKGTLQMMEDARADGVPVYCDQYPYVASSTGLDAVLPLWVLEGGHARTVERLQDADVREQVREVIKNHPYGNWTRVLIADVRRQDGPNRRFVGQHVQGMAEAWDRSPEDAVMDLLVEEGGEVGAIYFSMADDDVEMVMRSPWTVVGSDAGARSSTGPLSGGHPHPRTYGTFPRALGYYVREKGVLSLSEAVRRMTGMPAQRFGLAERGLVRPGWWADLVAFDPDRVRDRATFVEPQQYPEGIRHVWVNGVAVVRNEEPTDALPGGVLRLGLDGGIVY